VRRVFHDQLDESARVLARQPTGNGDAEVNARSDATAGEAIAIDADALVAGDDASTIIRPSA